MAELVYSIRNIKFHDRGIKRKSCVNPFTITERVIEGENIKCITKKVIIRNGKSKVIESYEIKAISGNSHQITIALKALFKLESIFNN